MIASDRSRSAGWRFFLWWMLTFLGFPLGGVLALLVVGSIDGAVWFRRMMSSFAGCAC